ncbi:MAG: hypothetical protein IPN72_24410 [Saprospiraceae bacterium]|nr:hypothetical protein [Saprospiraceae bacterium]
MNAGFAFVRSKMVMDGALEDGSTDALAEEHPSTSPYVYALNNPIYFL